MHLNLFRSPFNYFLNQLSFFNYLNIKISVSQLLSLQNQRWLIKHISHEPNLMFSIKNVFQFISKSSIFQVKVAPFLKSKYLKGKFRSWFRCTSENTKSIMRHEWKCIKMNSNIFLIVVEFEWYSSSFIIWIDLQIWNS